MTNISPLTAAPVPPIYLQVGTNTPLPQGLESVTQPLYPSQSLLFRLRNFPSEVYSLAPGSHLLRLMGVILGDAGGEQLIKREVFTRLREVMSSTSFLDLDAFWGSLFGLTRTADEQFPINPATGVVLNPYQDSATANVWNAAQQADASYKARIFNFAQAINYGASPVGIKKVSEAVLGCPVDLYESFQQDTASYLATIVPYRSLFPQDVLNLHNILATISPANVTVEILSGQSQPNLEVPLNTAWASSSYWEIVATITPGPNSLFSSTTERPRYAFSAYQGEQWCLNSSINNVTAQWWDASGNVLSYTDFEHFLWLDGSYTNYTPDLSVEPAWEVALGRIAQSGVTISNIVNNQDTLSDVLVDGMNLADLVALLSGVNLNTANNPNAYWSTPARMGTDTSQEVATYFLDTTHILSSISLEVANFPHTVNIEVQYPGNQAWYQVYSQTIATSSPIQFGDPTTYLLQHLHPQHSGTAPWVGITTTFNPTDVTGVRVILQRFNGIGPLNPGGSAAPYSLGIRNFALNASIGNQQALPVGGGNIDSTYNLVGDHVTYSTYIEQPSAAIDGSGQWRCSPQVSPNAVVNYYLDSRNSSGGPQVIDSFFVSPTHVGVKCNLYWTNQSPGESGVASDNPIATTVTGGPIATVANGLQFSSTVTQYVSVPAQELLLVDNWWLGMSFIPSTTNTSVTTYALATLGGLILSVVDGYAQVTLPGGAVYINPTPLVAGATNNIVLAFVDQNANSDLASNVPQLYLYVNGVGVSQAVVSTITESTALTIGGSILPTGPSALCSGITLLNMVLKGEALTSVTAQGFSSTPRPYCYKGQYYFQDQGFTYNAYLRFDPTFISDINPVGFVGGTPDVMATLEWVPVAADFVLTQGYLSFPPVSASFWKFELTNLVAEPYGVYLPIPNSMQVFSPQAPSAEIAPSTYAGYVPVGTQTQINQVSGETMFNASSTIITPNPDPRVASPTQTAVATDPNVASALSGQYPLFGYIDWHQGSVAPVNAAGGSDNYLTIDTTSSNQIGFFAGFYSVAAYRTNVSAQVDTPIYHERFLDTANIEF